MYTLRVIDETRENKNMPFDQVIENYELGKAYAKLVNGFTKEFDTVMERYPDVDKNTIECIICSDYGDEYFIKRNEKDEDRIYTYFIMSDSGKTFEKL